MNTPALAALLLPWLAAPAVRALAARLTPRWAALSVACCAALLAAGTAVGLSVLLLAGLLHLPWLAAAGRLPLAWLAATSPVPVRVAALLAPAPRAPRGRLLHLVVAGLLTVVGTTAATGLGSAYDLHEYVEQGQATSSPAAPANR
ncbi:hypothetical protein [Kitasatospora sp. DSM 101779]|uniref:hypothetical protein n=1 Tax=Kitasatospora sp. DSM 101779 TaxID=2853165 RepID=UPI0021DB71DC|nr:hypothetical protein [Kitasatospora sp. DSM 101779]MCU7820588.1 hypothetical protein [Kitasatospora sp. DSM 101779]